MLIAAELPNIAVNTPMWLALLTTGVAAIEGAAVGRSRETAASLDIVGMAVFALLFGLGGGFARDTMLGITPFMSLRTPWYVITVLAAVVLVLVVGRWIPVHGRVFIMLDALTLGLYAAIGTQHAMDYGVPAVGAVLVGVVASTTGGILVAILQGQVPTLLVSGPPYALLGLTGSVIYLALDSVNSGLAALACVLTVVVLRAITLRFKISTPSVQLKD